MNYLNFDGCLTNIYCTCSLHLAHIPDGMVVCCWCSLRKTRGSRAKKIVQTSKRQEFGLKLTAIDLRLVAGDKHDATSIAFHVASPCTC